MSTRNYAYILTLAHQFTEIRRETSFCHIKEVPQALSYTPSSTPCLILPECTFTSPARWWPSTPRLKIGIDNCLFFIKTLPLSYEWIGSDNHASSCLCMVTALNCHRKPFLLNILVNTSEHRIRWDKINIFIPLFQHFHSNFYFSNQCIFVKFVEHSNKLKSVQHKTMSSVPWQRKLPWS